MRDIILGVNDGLVSTFLLVAGVVGGGLGSRQVFLTAVAGAIAGAVSMAAGEYLATESQEEVFDREIELERDHIEHHRDAEVDQLYGFFEEMGVDGEDLDTVVEVFAKTDNRLLNAMKRLEFGIVDSERRSPWAAMFASGALFLLGALTSVLPFAFASDAAIGLAWAGVFTSAGLFAVGVAKTRVTNTNPFTAGMKNLMITVIGAVVAYIVGAIFDANVA
jgi:VIT1/CCC1 family predicted Fe2+/Mn2+ transporter